MKTISYKKILVPFDFTQEHKQALGVAEKIAASSGATITLLHVADPGTLVTAPFPNVFITGLGVYMLQLPDSEKMLRSVVAASELPASRFDIKLFVGSLDKSIFSFSEAIPHDLIIVPDFSRAFLKFQPGIDVLRLMEKTKVPVIVANTAISSSGIRNILLPVTEVKDWFHKVPFTVALARLTRARITVLALVSNKSGRPVTATLKKLLYCKNYLSKNYSNFEIIKTQVSSEPFNTALDLAKRCNADLISITPPEKASLFSAGSGRHFYNKIVSHGSIPVFGVMA